jgi:hypothetical protein
VAAIRSGHVVRLLHWANAIRLTRTTLLTGTRVMTVSTTMSGRYVGKVSSVTILVHVHTVANSRAEFHRICKNAGHGAGGYVDDVIDWAPSLRESREVSSQKAETLLASDGHRWNTGVQAQQIGNWSGVLGTATGTDWSHVLDKGQEISTRRRCNWNPESGKQMSQ